MIDMCDNTEISYVFHLGHSLEPSRREDPAAAHLRLQGVYHRVNVPVGYISEAGKVTVHHIGAAGAGGWAFKSELTLYLLTDILPPRC
jgi:hypothetical protein